MNNVTTLIKPASGNCQLRCKYCFYHSIKDNNRKKSSYGMMSIDTIESIIKKAIKESSKVVNIAFQGGEPTLRGLEFYKKVIELENKYNDKGLEINNSIQTNGIVIDEKWAEFFKENKFLVGLSLDGYKEIHDMHRIDEFGKGTYNKVMKTVELFNKYGVEYNILFVVTKATTRHIQKIYKFYKKNNFRYLQFIPCLDPLGKEPGKEPYSLESKDFEKFLISLFKLYYNDFIEGNYISIRYFDNLIRMILGNPPEACGMSGVCSIQNVIEADGSVFPCDFYCIDKWYLGNIKDKTFVEISKTKVADDFIEISKQIDDKCKKCKYYNICRGGCRRTREPMENDKLKLQYFCKSYYNFFETCKKEISHMAHIINKK